MTIKNCIYTLLIAVSILKPVGAAGLEVVAPLHAMVEEIQARAVLFSGKGYTAEADALARKTTTQLLTPLADRVATAAEAEAMVDAHLRAELYYAFNTQWGSGKIRNHRIVHDFLSQLNKAEAKNANQKEHLTAITVLSLAAQEYFWNEKSTVDDLKTRAKRELRYGLFNQAGHKLNISTLTYLDDISLERITNQWVNDVLVEKLKALMVGFKAKTLGSTYTAIIGDLAAKFAGVTQQLPIDLFAETVAPFGLAASLDLKHVTSCGDGMCGEHSLLIPTDGGPVGIQEGNGRYKILRAIFDNKDDPEAKRLYLLASQHMDGPKFVALMERQIAALKLVSAAQADELQVKLDIYRQHIVAKNAEKEEYIEASKKTLLVDVIRLPGLTVALSSFSTMLNTPAQLAALPGNKLFRNIIDEIIKLRTVNAELERLLSTVDAQVTQLDTDTVVIKKTAEQVFAAAQQKQQLVGANVEKFNVTNAAVIKINNELVTAQLLTASGLERLTKVPATPQQSLQVARTASEKAAANFSKFQAGNPQFFVELAKNQRECLEASGVVAKIQADFVAATNAKIAARYVLIGTVLKDFISVSMLPGSPNAFTIGALCERGYGNFINDVCQGACELTGDTVTATAIDGLWNTFDAAKNLITTRTEQQLTSQRVEIASSLVVPPAELTPESLKQEMLALANGPGELSGCLPCDALYTQLWAVINNLNVFVFSSGESFGRPPLDVMTRFKDRPYERATFTYPAGTTGKHLATVILTSSTAKNVFLDMIPGHYDKFIDPTDYAAMARAQRHLAWMADPARYSLYPQ